MIGLLAAFSIFGRRAQRSVYAQAEGQPGAAGWALDNMRGQWRVTIGVDGNTHLDAVHRVIGRPGHRAGRRRRPAPGQRADRAEKKRIARVIGTTPIYEVVVGNEEGQVPLSKLQRHLTKLPRNISSEGDGEPRAPAERARLAQRRAAQGPAAGRRQDAQRAAHRATPLRLLPFSAPASAAASGWRRGRSRAGSSRYTSVCGPPVSARSCTNAYSAASDGPSSAYGPTVQELGDRGTGRPPQVRRAHRNRAAAVATASAVVPAGAGPGAASASPPVSRGRNAAGRRPGRSCPPAAASCGRRARRERRASGAHRRGEGRVLRARRGRRRRGRRGPRSRERAGRCGVGVHGRHVPVSAGEGQARECAGRSCGGAVVPAAAVAVADQRGHDQRDQRRAQQRARHPDQAAESIEATRMPTAVIPRWPRTAQPAAQ